MSALLEVDRLNVRFSTPEGRVHAVNEVSFRVWPGEVLAVVGESGSGKSQVFLSIMGLLAGNGKASGNVRFLGREVMHLPIKELNRLRGRHMAMIFQDPMTALNPYLKINRQMTEVLMIHKGLTMFEARRQCIAMLERVNIPDARRRMDMHPHQFSGGMRQRIMIAMALLCEPELLIADEPTTALDVTLQAQIVHLLRELSRNASRSVILITHDLGVVAGLADRVLVMYGGRIVETAPTGELFDDPRHPYTQGLLQSVPRLDDPPPIQLFTLPGQPPNLQHLPPGCAFQDRCIHSGDLCREVMPSFVSFGNGRGAACHRLQS
jgi:oligopeptide transport system ATP-binding protein